jgi:enoyl-CoA hydratase/carnithine racemase
VSGGSVGYDVGADGVAVVELRRPEARNALGAAMRAGLWDAYRRFRDDDTARVMLLCAQGPHFCAGGDLKEMAETGMDRPPADFLPVPGQTIELTKPVVAAVQGAAHGGGFLFAQCSDLVVAGESASFGITEARWGRGAPWASSLPDLIGTRRALELLLTAEPVDAFQALAFGFVNRVVPDAELRSEATALAARVAGNAPLSVQAGKAMVYGTRGLDPAAAAELAERLFEPVYDSADAQEGPRAFRERRLPAWTG